MITIKEIKRSFEPCSEAGWFGYNVIINEPFTESCIQKLSELGNLLYLSKLKTPFFTFKNKNVFIKGILGGTEIRIGFPKIGEEQIMQVFKLLNQEE